MTVSEINELIAQGEGETVEFKETTGQRGDACKTLCAFLNGQGGTVFFGVTRKGKLTGQLMADSTKRDLFETFQKFEPSADIEVAYVPVDETHVAIVCRVEKGNGRPYAYDATPYKRVQSSTTVMSQEEYGRMLSERGGFRSDWELQENPRLTIDEIDLDEVKKTARMAVQVGRLDPDVDTDDAVMLLKKFKLMRGDRLLNAAAVLFGNDAMIDYPQCEIKMARFKGTGKNEFGDERREEGNIFKLLAEATQFCFKHLNLSAKVIPTQIERDEHLEIPPEALREALLNAFVHRQYSKSGAVSLAIYDDRLEVTSPGGFPPGKTVEQITTEHESEPRNERIAHVLYLRKTIETWGRGFDRIRSECEKEGVPPPTVVEKDGYVRLTFARTVQLSKNSVQLNSESCTETGKVGKKRGQEIVGQKQETKVGQKPEKASQKCTAEVSQKLEKVSQKSEAKVSQKSGKVSQKSGQSDMRLTEIRRRAACSIDVVLPSLRRDVRKNLENVMVAIGVNPYVTICEISKQIHVSVATVKNAEALLKEVGLLYRIGGDRGGHWLISWKGGK